MPAPAPLNEQFNDSYGMRGITSSNPAWNLQAANDNAEKLQAANDNKRQGGVRNIKVTKKVTGTAMKATGTSMQFAGKGMKAAGKTTTKAGARLTATGIGAIVGVPLLAVGGAATGVGVGTEVAGKQVSRAGRNISKNSSSKRKLLKQVTNVKGASFHARALSAGMYFMPIILFLGMLEIVFLVLGLAADAVLDTTIDENEDGVLEQAWKYTLGGVETVFNTLSDAVSAATGGVVDLAGLIGALHPGNYFVIFYVFTVAICYMTLISIWFVYDISGAKPLSGSGEGSKRAGFLIALCFYSIPVAHIIPWFLVWSWAILKNEK